MCNMPRNPHRKPLPRVALDSRVKVTAGSVKTNFYKLCIINGILSLEQIEVSRINRIYTCIHHRFGWQKSWLWLYFLFDLKERIPNSCLFNQFHITEHIANLPRSQHILRSQLRLQDPNIKNLITFIKPTRHNSRPFLHTATHNIEQTYNILPINKPTIN